MAKSTHPLLLRLAPPAAAGRDGHCLAAGLVRRLAVDAGAALAGGGGIESVLDPLGQR